ncbi:hypothetical protein [Mesonia maritima]|uniref:Type III secretory pathway component EscR n=1 Tax=Mesonia maritima TaxID=1793873 RepID=A0ABU1K1P0_9FLAO|nr:hypothetical protein [Mesonia maritima]MDR6299508.1 type III secretory pathway component EscR [Mesonia maritima]
MVKKILIILLISIVAAVAVGFYFRIFEENEPTGDKIIGIAVLASCFIMMPIFLYHRWKGKKLKDYTLSPENLNKMKEKGID